MQTAQRNSLRLLQWMMAASLALPLALFIFASAISWISINETADREIERSLDVVHEHGLSDATRKRRGHVPCPDQSELHCG